MNYWREGGTVSAAGTSVLKHTHSPRGPILILWNSFYETFARNLYRTLHLVGPQGRSQSVSRHCFKASVLTYQGRLMGFRALVSTNAGAAVPRCCRPQNRVRCHQLPIEIGGGPSALKS